MNKTIAESGLLSKAMVTIETVTTVDGIAALRPCYEHLHRITGNTLPFALHEWHLAWCRHFLNCTPRIRDEPLFHVLRDSAGVCVAIVPLIVSRRLVGPLRIVSVNLLGADPAITEVRAPLIDPDYEYLTACAVRDQLAKIGDWDWIHWCGISDAFARALATGGRLQWQPPLSDYVLDMAPTWEEFRRRLKRNIRESLRHCYNSLKRDHHSFELRVIEDPRELRRGLDRFLELHALRAALESPVHANRFASRVTREFLYDVCERLGKRGAVRLFQLEVDSQIVAMRIGFRGGRRPLLVLLRLRPEMVSIQRHDHDGGRGDQVCDCPRPQDRQPLTHQGHIEAALEPAPSRLSVRVRTGQRACTPAWHAART